MYLSTNTAFLTGLLALTTTAAPLTTNSTLQSRNPHKDSFQIHVWNNCGWTKEFALYSVSPSFQMQQRSTPVNIAHGKSHIIHAPFHATGMRLSGHAELGPAGQWAPSALFEFGYSSYGGKVGTAYDVSIMQGSDANIGLGVWPISNGHGSGNCASKVCWPWYCPLDQGWTNPDQVNQGSPADTVCYEGKTDFKVVFCP